MNSKEYVMPDGKKVVFEYDHDGIGKVTIEAMDMLMGLIADGRKRGEWKRVLADKYVHHAYHFYRCSKCGYDHIDKTNFCPSCGADMREREGE